jgi:hypothetical protein
MWHAPQSTFCSCGSAGGAPWQPLQLVITSTKRFRWSVAFTVVVV